MSRILLLVALEAEFSTYDLRKFANLNIKLVYTGIGKINATYHTCREIQLFRPDLILNLGTCGALNPKHIGKVLEIGKVVEHDMNCEPLSMRGVVPFDESPTFFKLSSTPFNLATGDMFVSEIDQWFSESEIDFVDMELFAIAKTAYLEGVPVRALKFASDMANEDASTDWNNSLLDSTLLLEHKLDQILWELNVKSEY